jgi:hypothetical protein
MVPLNGPGANEESSLMPLGEYANSAIGRERIFSWFSNRNHTPMLLYRLCYAIDLRYGVLVDVASKVMKGIPVDVSMGAVNVIWQGDANARAIQSLALTASPVTRLNVTGRDRILIRDLANRFGEKFGRTPIFSGAELEKAWLWDATKSYELFGPPEVTLESMIDATAHWLSKGGELLNKPTHFEVHDGEF